jgi:hypothetical protein
MIDDRLLFNSNYAPNESTFLTSTTFYHNKRWRLDVLLGGRLDSLR